MTGLFINLRHVMSTIDRECLLLFGAESFVLQVAIQKLKD